MEEKIRILAIAPYEGMQFLLNKVAQDYPQIQMDVLVGDLQQGVEAAQNNFHAGRRWQNSFSFCQSHSSYHSIHSMHRKRHYGC